MRFIIILRGEFQFRKDNMKINITSPIYIIIGIIAAVLGFIGIFVPFVLPTTPFLLLASFCFAKGSTRFHKWFTSTKLYKKHLEDFEKDRSMTLKTKIGLLLFASSMMAFPIFRTKSNHLRIFLIIVVIFKYYYFIFRIRTIKKDSNNLQKESSLKDGINENKEKKN